MTPHSMTAGGNGDIIYRGASDASSGVLADWLTVAYMRQSVCRLTVAVRWMAEHRLAVSWLHGDRL